MEVKNENELIEAFFVSQGGKPSLPADIDFYSSDWNMLMPVVEKIRPLWQKSQEELVADLMVALFTADIHKAHQSVVAFIKWYNSTPKEGNKP